MKKVFSFIMIMFVFGINSTYAGDMQIQKVNWTIIGHMDGQVKTVPVTMGYEIDYGKREIVGILNLPTLHREVPQIVPEQALFVGPYTKGKTKLIWMNSGHPNVVSGYIEANIP